MVILVACVEAVEELDYRRCDSEEECQDFAVCVLSEYDCLRYAPFCQRPCVGDSDCPEHPHECQPDGYCVPLFCTIKD